MPLALAIRWDVPTSNTINLCRRNRKSVSKRRQKDGDERPQRQPIKPAAFFISQKRRDSAAERFGALNEELVVLNTEARQLEERIAENVAKMLGNVVS